MVQPGPAIPGVLNCLKCSPLVYGTVWRPGISRVAGLWGHRPDSETHERGAVPRGGRETLLALAEGEEDRERFQE